MWPVCLSFTNDIACVIGGVCVCGCVGVCVCVSERVHETERMEACVSPEVWGFEC